MKIGSVRNIFLNIFSKRNFVIFFILLFLAVPIYFLSSTIWIYNSGQRLTYASVEKVEEFEVMIIFGAGVRPDGTPHDMLYDRLRTAAEIYDTGKIDKILVSGDNRFENYDEPTTMRNYLINEFGIPADVIVADYAGRRTYDTCARAGELWNVSKALLISQGYHLPRSIFTCRELGIEAYGYSATLNSYIGMENYKLREFFAIQKAIIDVYLIPPEYVGGEKEEALME